MGEIFEILMIVLFGCSWPANVIKSFRSRTAEGKSLAFLVLILSGYVSGILGKIISGNFRWYVMFFYVLNAVMVSADLCLYFRNRRLDREKINSAGIEVQND